MNASIKTKAQVLSTSSMCFICNWFLSIAGPPSTSDLIDDIVPNFHSAKWRVFDEKPLDGVNQGTKLIPTGFRGQKDNQTRRVHGYHNKSQHWIHHHESDEYQRKFWVLMGRYHWFCFIIWGLKSELVAAFSLSAYMASLDVIWKPNLSLVCRHKFRSISTISSPSFVRLRLGVRLPFGAVI